jgi:hypothetical protein
VAVIASALILEACAGAREAPRVELPLHASLRPEAVDTNMGYRVELNEARLVLEDVEFAVGGEAHASSAEWFSRWLLPHAQAHGGHLTGGEVTGELRGRFVARWRPNIEAPLGTASLIAGQYESVNFTLIRDTSAEPLSFGDSSPGQGVILRGVAVRSDERREFLAVIDVPAPGSKIAGVPFAGSVRGGMSARLALELALRDPFEGDTLFDGIDFGRLRPDESGVATIATTASDAAGRAAHALLAVALQGPDHFEVHVVP